MNKLHEVSLERAMQTIKVQRSKTHCSTLQEFSMLFCMHAEKVLASCSLLEHAQIAEKHFLDRVSSLFRHNLKKTQMEIILGTRDVVSKMAKAKIQDLEGAKVDSEWN